MTPRWPLVAAAVVLGACTDSAVSFTVPALIVSRDGVRGLGRLGPESGRSRLTPRCAREEEEEDLEAVRVSLRQEAENPFRAFRRALWPVLGAGALLGLAVSLEEVASGKQSLDEAGLNVAVDVLATAAFAGLYQWDSNVAARREARARRGAELASLRVRIVEQGKTIQASLSSLRRDRGQSRRAVIIAGTAAAVLPSVQASLDCADALLDTDLLVVPYILDGGEGEAAAIIEEGHPHLAWPSRNAAWRDLVADEISAAQEQGVSVDGGGAPGAPQAIVIVIKKNGRVGKRGFTPPGESLAWSSLIADVRNRRNMGMDVTNI